MRGNKNILSVVFLLREWWMRHSSLSFFLISGGDFKHLSGCHIPTDNLDFLLHRFPLVFFSIMTACHVHKRDNRRNSNNCLAFGFRFCSAATYGMLSSHMPVNRSMKWFDSGNQGVHHYAQNRWQQAIHHPDFLHGALTRSERGCKSRLPARNLRLTRKVNEVTKLLCKFSKRIGL